MSARPRILPSTSARRSARRSPRRSPRRLLALLAIGTLATVGFAYSAPSDGAFAAKAVHGPTHVPTALERSVEAGTLMDDLDSGKVTEQDVLDAGEHGLTVHGHRMDGWTDPTAEQRAGAEQVAAQLRADPAIATLSGDTSDVRAAMDDLADPAAVHPPALRAPVGSAGITESKHWWNKVFTKPIDWLRAHTPHIYINGPWFKAIVGAGVAVGMMGLCVFFDFSKVTCALVGIAAGAVVELLKNTRCARNGLQLYWPLAWLSHCA